MNMHISKQAQNFDDDDEKSLQVLDLKDDTALISLSIFNSSHRQHQHLNNSFGNILSSSRHSMGTTIGSIKKGVQSISKKATNAGPKRKKYCELDDISSEVLKTKEGSVGDDLNRDSGHSGTSTSDLTNEHSFAGDEEDNDYKTELEFENPKCHDKTIKHSPSRLNKKNALLSSTANTQMRLLSRKASVGASASRSLPRNRKIRRANDGSLNSPRKNQQQQAMNQFSHCTRFSAQKLRHVDAKVVLERCTNSAFRMTNVASTSPNKANRHLLNTAPRSPVIRGDPCTSLNCYIGRISPHKAVTQCQGRERVQFDFDRKDIRSIMVNTTARSKLQPATPKITQPMVDHVVMDMERLSINHL